MKMALPASALWRKAATVPVADGEPGHEVQVDTGWVLRLEPDGTGVRRRKKAFIFTPNVSRYRFVYPIDRETTAEAIAVLKHLSLLHAEVGEHLVQVGILRSDYLP